MGPSHRLGKPVVVAPRECIVSRPSRVPSCSDGAESIGKNRYLGEHGGEPLDQWQQQRWPGKSAQRDKWNFCLRAARIAAAQEST